MYFADEDRTDDTDENDIDHVLKSLNGAPTPERIAARKAVGVRFWHLWVPPAKRQTLAQG